MIPTHPKLRQYSDALILLFVGLVAALVFALMALSLTGTALDFDTVGAPEAGKARAVEFHGNLPTVGPGVNAANGGIHNIAGIKERQGRNDGTPPACTAHGGLGAANKNC